MTVDTTAEFISAIKNHTKYRCSGFDIRQSGQQVSQLSLALDKLNKDKVFDLYTLCMTLDPTPETVYTTFTNITDRVFENGINWGRVATIIDFAAVLFTHCAMREHFRHVVDDLPDKFAQYISHKTGSWVREHGGVDELIRFATCKPWSALWFTCLLVGPLMGAGVIWTMC